MQLLLIVKVETMMQLDNASNSSKTLNSMPNSVTTLTEEIEKLTNQEEILGVLSKLVITRLHAKFSEKLEIGKTVWIKLNKKVQNF